jgi:TfoX/Sxy family transcriptional regulator of competence genes
MAPGSMPRPSDEAKSAFRDLVPEDPAVTVRPMFGNLSAFVNGNMFAGIFGDELFVRLPDAERGEVRSQGGADFEPMPGRAMRGYVTVPGGLSGDRSRELVSRSLAWARELPAKEPGRRRS